jgi:hypothetical protein
MPTSPCTSCSTLADCSACAPYGHWLGQHPDATCTTCVDVDWLTMSGEAWEQIAARLGIKPASLARHLHRHGRPDLAPKRVLA